MVVASNAAGEARSIADLVVEEEKSPDEEKLISYQEFSSVQQKKEVRICFIFKHFVSVFYCNHWITYIIVKVFYIKIIKCRQMCFIDTLKCLLPSFILKIDKIFHNKL